MYKEDFLMSSTCELIREHVASLQPEQILSPRDLLAYGSRKAVDSSIYLLFREKRLARVARGLYVLIESNLDLISAEQIARAKARAFGRVIERQDESDDCLYFTDGPSTKFQSIKGRIEMRRLAPRKLILCKNKIGLAALKVWRDLNEGRFEAARMSALLESKERAILLGLSRFLPAWLTDIISGRSRLPVA